MSQKVVNNPLGAYLVATDRASDYTQRQAVGLDFGVVTGGIWTARRVSAADPLPVTPSSSSGGESLGTAVTYSQVSCNNASSTQILAANTSRKKGSFLYNDTSSIFWIKEGAVAVRGEGGPIFPGNTYQIISTLAVNGILASGGPSIINAVDVS